MVKVLKTRYHWRKEEFGIELPKNVKQALEIDKETGTDFWRHTLIKEMGILEPHILIDKEGEGPPPGYMEIRTHIVFDIKMDFTTKTQIIADGSSDELDPNYTYASVVSRDSIHIAFLYAALNDMYIIAGDVAAGTQVGEKVYSRCRPEFGSPQGHLAI